MRLCPAGGRGQEVEIVEGDGARGVREEVEMGEMGTYDLYILVESWVEIGDLMDMAVVLLLGRRRR